MYEDENTAAIRAGLSDAELVIWWDLFGTYPTSNPVQRERLDRLVKGVRRDDVSPAPEPVIVVQRAQPPPPAPPSEPKPEPKPRGRPVEPEFSMRGGRATRYFQSMVAHYLCDVCQDWQPAYRFKRLGGTHAGDERERVCGMCKRFGRKESAA